ncbi:carbohydrate kinase [Hamadaea sp. NPDC051192]|uniref:carbohydrate kinase family protein n=1 Tax=Hamadaea sp. NPDC051192 TaxID=3154940 RepID=UPI00341E52AA
MSILVIGEALLDIVNGQRRPGGSPMNVAVGLARLGLTTVLHTSLGGDDAGRLVERHLVASGVHITPESWTSRPTSVAEVQLDRFGNATYRFDITWDPAPITAAPEGVQAIHVGSIGAVLPPGASAVDAILDTGPAVAIRSYDLNIRPGIMPSQEVVRQRAENLIARTDIVKASEEDVAWLYPARAPEQVLEHWLGIGARMAVLTRGGQGARAINATTTVDVAAPPTNVRDTIGAGDSFMAGLLAALDDGGALDRERLSTLSEEQVRGIMEFAVRCASVTVTREGADPPVRADVCLPVGTADA